MKILRKMKIYLVILNDIKTVCKSFGNIICHTLLGFHGITCCETTVSPFSEVKLSHLRKYDPLTKWIWKQIWEQLLTYFKCWIDKRYLLLPKINEILNEKLQFLCSVSRQFVFKQRRLILFLSTEKTPQNF